MKEIFRLISNLPDQHIIFTIFSLVIGLILIIVYANSKELSKKRIFNYISIVIIANEVLFQVLLIYFGEWSFKESLPLEMCYISALTIPFYNLDRNNRKYQNWLFFAGFGGSFFAFINTNLEDGSMVYTFIHYFVAHGLIIIVVLAQVFDGYRPRWIDYFNTIKYTVFLVLFMFLFNSLIGSNYMFTHQRPPGVTIADFMPTWPYGFFNMLLIGLTFYTLLVLVKLIPQKKSNIND